MSSLSKRQITLVTVALLLGCFSLIAQQSQQISVNLKNATLQELFTTIESQTKYRFAYRDVVLNKTKMINIRKTNASVQTVLSEALASTGLSFSVISDNSIVITEKRDETKGKAQRITGVVLDEKGDPIIGANVSVKGTNIGSITDLEGRFVLEVPSNAILAVSYVGYISTTQTVGNQSSLKIELKENTQVIDEIVVVGYGTQLKRNVSTAVSSVGSEKLEAVTAALSPSQALVGQVSGVRIQQVSGAPGENAAIRIRGSGSITSGNNPLYVIDGFPTNDAALFSSILPGDIESIDVLKDAAAAAIYGSRAGNGVIIVTTKKGKEGKVSFTADISLGFEQLASRYEMLKGKEFIDMAKESLTYNGKSIPAFMNDPSRWVETDWQDAIFRTAPFQKYQITATGGNEKMKFSISGGYIDQQGVLVNSYMKRYNFRIAFDANLSKTVKVGANLLPSYTEHRDQDPSGQNNTSDMRGIIAEALSMPPVLPVFRENGDHFVIFQDRELKSVFNDQLSNPLNKLEANEDYRRIFRQSANAYIHFTPIKGLTLSTTLNLGLASGQRDMYVSGIYSRGGNKTGNISTPELNAINARRDNYTNINWYWSSTATYNFKLTDKHDFTVLLGYDVAQNNNNGSYLVPRTDKDNPVAFDNFVIRNVMGAVLNQGGSNREEYVFDAMFGRLNYSFQNRYLFSASIRRDRSSKFGPNNRSGWFPSVSAAWNLSEESFMKNIEQISLLKLRASYGETGNDQLSGYYNWVSTMAKEYYVFGQGSTDYRGVGYKPSGFTNYQLGWEKNRQVDVGLEVGFLRNRINLAADFYVRNSNTILDAAVPIINGKSGTIIQNVGNVRNTGFEFTINTINLTGPLTWKTDLNLSINKNKITELGLNQTQLKNNTAGTFWGDVVRNYLGRPMSDLYMYVVEGTFNNEADVAKYPKNGTQGVGDLRFKDVSGPKGVPDGVITAHDMTYVGNSQPDFIWGMTNTLNYKGFDLSILLDGVVGGKLINAMERPISLNRELENATARSGLGRWRSESDPGNGFSQRAGSKNLGSNIGPNTRFLYDASFFRIRNITFGYTLPAKISKKAYLQNLRFYASVLNLYTFTGFPGYNPEGNYQKDNATNDGVDQGSYPLPRNVSFGVTANF